jgi:isoleucyl-tRNA synthetase
LAKQFSELSKKSVKDTEMEIASRWEDMDLLQKTIDNREGCDDFVFYEGPPTANGKPGIHHVIARTLKDSVCKYQTMKGHRVNRVFGWDTHGLPAELEAQKELGIDSVDQIKELGIDKFNDACRASVLKYTNEWKDYVHRQARWVDFEHGYKTLNITYMESVMWAFKQLYDKGLAYQGYRVLPYCPKNTPSLFTSLLPVSYASSATISRHSSYGTCSGLKNTGTLCAGTSLNASTPSIVFASG